MSNSVKTCPRKGQVENKSSRFTEDERKAMKREAAELIVKLGYATKDSLELESVEW